MSDIYRSYGRENGETAHPNSADKRFLKLGRRENTRENNRRRRAKLSPILLTTPNNDPCGEILARAQFGEALSDRHREALRKECQS